jgi:hypothetical protein
MILYIKNLAVLIIMYCTITNNKVMAQYNLDSIVNALPADTLLQLKTYDGSGQSVHPDVVLTKDKNGRDMFLMVHTPYPFYQDKFENPCLYYSYNGINFEPIDSLTNPIVNVYKVDSTKALPHRNHNDDPDIIYDAKKQQWLIHYLATFNPDSQNVVQLSSKDLVHWTKRDAIKYKDLITVDPFPVSPSVCPALKRGYVMFYVSNKGEYPKNTIEYITTKSLYKWNKNKRTQVTIEGMDTTITPWHIDVIKHTDGYYYMTLCGYRKGFNWFDDKQVPDYVLLYARSTNLKDWAISSTNVNPCVNGTLKDCSYIYRSSAVFTQNYLLMYYSYFSTWRHCYLGVKKIALKDLKF